MSHDTRADKMVPVTAGRPCPVCEKPDWCLIAPDGTACLCQRVEAGSKKKCGDAGWLHVLVERPREHRRPSTTGKKKAAGGKLPPAHWQAEAKRFAAFLTADTRARLETALGLPAGGLDCLPLVGLSPGTADTGVTTWPETDAQGHVIGINRRWKSGVKKAVAGSKRGLTLPAGWRDRPGPLFVVEGPTDAAVLTAGGLSAVGTFAAGQGAKLLAELLTDWTAERDIVVVGENDRKDDGSWPGKDGATRLAAALATAIRRPVAWALTPDGAKDARAWMTHPDRGHTAWPDRGAEFAAKLLAGAETVNPPDPDTPGGGRRDAAGRPVIVVGCDEHRVNAEATDALAREPDIYQRGGLLVSVQTQDADSEATAAIRRAAGTPVVRELPKPLLRERLTAVAEWVKVTEEGEERVHPPGWAVDAVHVRGDWPRVRRLEAVTTHPVVLPDGTVLAANGYHRPSGLFVALPPDLRVSVPENPTGDDLAGAVAALFDPLADFPFESPEHRAALVAGLLTSLAWFAFTGPAPWFVIDKNVRGAGAGLLADVVAYTLTGHRFPVMSYTNDKEELRKKITTAAVGGERLLLLDNLAGAVGNDVMDMALTADRWKDRLLGGNRMYDGPLHVCWWGTANNVQLSADTSRRVCHIRMESPDERPEMREGFRHPDLRAHVKANRGRLLSAALTILRGWFAAGKPRHGLKAWGSYEPWSDVVRECVVFAGLPDPGETRLALQTAADRDAGAMETILVGFERLDADRRGLTATEVVAALKADDPPADWKGEMRAAVEELVGKLDARLLGYKLRHFKRRNFGGKMLDKAGTDAAHGNRWKVFPVDPRRAGPSPTSPPSSGVRADAVGDEGDVGDDPAPKMSAPPRGRVGDEGDVGDDPGREKSAPLPAGKVRRRPNPNRGVGGNGGGR